MSPRAQNNPRGRENAVVEPRALVGRNKKMKILKYDSFVEYSLGLHLLEKKNTKVIYEGPANECTLDIDVTILNTVKWLIITK
jgi:hypothetical protein